MAQCTLTKKSMGKVKQDGRNLVWTGLRKEYEIRNKISHGLHVVLFICISGQ